MYPNTMQPSMIPAQRQVPPTSSAVNIQIFEPKNYSTPEAAYQQPVYNYPTNNFYDYNHATQVPYGYPPVMVPQMPAPQVAQFPVPAEVPSVPVAAPAPVVVAPATPAPVVAAVQQVVTPAASTAPAPATPAPAPAVSAVDIAGLVANLKSANLDDQIAAIQKVAQIAQEDKQAAQTLNNEELFKSLAEIVTKDTKTLVGPDAKQLELRQKEQSGTALTPEEQAQIVYSPQEKAELNKQYGIYTLAILQKNFRDAVDQELKNQGAQPISINELPGIVQIVENIKSDSNPAIRDAGLSALKYIAKLPEDKEVLKTIFDIAAKQDPDPAVRQSAETAIKELQLV